MQTDADQGLRTTEKRVYTAYWQDGSVDLFAGIGLTSIGIAWILDLVALGPIAPAVAVTLWAPFRQRVVEPRLGHVRFGAARRGRLKMAHLILVVLGCATLMLGVGAYLMRDRGGASADGPSEDWVRLLVPALPGVLMALGAILSAGLFSIPRFALYALPLLAGGIIVVLIDGDPGVVMPLVGSVLLARFLKEFPVLSNELE